MIARLFQGASPAFIPQKTCELVNKIVSGGLQISYRFTRAPHLFSTTMVSVELQLQNLSKDNFKDIRIGQKVSEASYLQRNSGMIVELASWTVIMTWVMAYHIQSKIATYHVHVLCW